MMITIGVTGSVQNGYCKQFHYIGKLNIVSPEDDDNCISKTSWLQNPPPHREGLVIVTS